MNAEELDLIVLNDGFRELYLQIDLLKKWREREIWGEVYVNLNSIRKLLTGMKRIVSRLEKVKK